jgi:oligosaccharide repeat unit polymerase
LIQAAPRPFPRPAVANPLWIWAALGHASVIWFGVSIFSKWMLPYMLAWMLAMVALVPVARRMSLRRFDPFEPINGICILYVIYFSVATVFNLNTPDKFGHLDLPFEESVVKGLLYATLALIALQFGYALARRRPVPPTYMLRPPAGNRVFLTALVVYLIGLTARLYGVSKGLHIKVVASDIYGQYGGLDVFYDYLGFLSTYGFILMMADGFASRKWGLRRIVALAVMLPIEVLFAFLAGPKEYFIPIVLGPVIVYHYARKRIPIRRALLPILVIGLVVFPVMTSYRSIAPADIRRLTFWDGAQYGISTVVTDISSRNPLEHIWWAGYLVAERMDGIYTFSAVIGHVPSTMDFQWGRTIAVGLFMLVPTFIWETKYDYLARIITWGTQIFGPATAGSGISITQPGELFLNFGAVGMVLGMVLMGYGIARLYFWLMGKGFFGVLVFAVLFPTLVIPEYPIAAYYSNAVKQAVILLLIGLAAGARTAAARAIRTDVRVGAPDSLASIPQRPTLRARYLP